MPAKTKRQAKTLAAATRKAKPKLDMWDLLYARIHQYTEAAIAESWKGGGDPADMEIMELHLKLARLELTNHIARMKEELT